MRDELDELLEKTLHEGEKPDASLNRTILGMVKEKEMRQKKRKSTCSVKKVTMAASLALVVVGGSMIASTVYGAFMGKGIFEKLSERGDVVDPDAYPLFDENPTILDTEDTKTMELEYVDYSVDELAYDGKTIVTQITVKAKNPDRYLLADSWSEEDRPADWLKIDGVTEEKYGTVGDYAKAVGKEIVSVDAYAFISESFFWDASIENERREDGSIVYTIMVFYTQEMEQDYATVQIGEGFQFNDYHYNEVKIQIENRSKIWETAEYETVVSELDNGVSNVRIKAETSELFTYVTVEYDNNTGDVVFPYLVDENGNEMESIASGNGRYVYANFDWTKVQFGVQHAWNAESDKDVHEGRKDGPYPLKKVE